MFKEKYYKMNEKISPSDELIQNIISNEDEKTKEQNKKLIRVRRPILVLCILLVCIFTVIPVLASTVPAINQLMYLVSPSVAQFFKPVQKSCVDNGIKMEVVSTYIHENTAEVYITMQDLEGERIDETTDLNDSYDISIPFDSSANCQFVGYDDITKTATFLINITEWGNRKITGDKLTFSVREFLSNKQEYNNILIKEDLSKIYDNSPTENVSLIGYGGKNYEKYLKNTGEAKMLEPIETMNFPISGIDFTGIGYIDDMLHVQISVTNNLKKNNHGSFSLIDKKGNVIQCDYNVRFVENIDSYNRIDYDEYIFNIPKSEIQNYSLYGNFVTSGMFTEGNWQVTFPLEK